MGVFEILFEGLMRHDESCAARRRNPTMSMSPSWSSRVLGSAALCGHRVRASASEMLSRCLHM